MEVLGNPYVLLLLLALAGGYYVVEKVKVVETKIAHVVKDAGAKVGHGLKRLVGK